MIASTSLIAGAALLLVLSVVAAQGWLASRDLREPPLTRCEEDVTERCPQEFVSRIFSRADWDFVRGLRSVRIERLYERERKCVALVWVRQTSAVIRNVMREHAGSARQSQNLDVLVELKILAQYLALMTTCAILSLTIQVAGPLWLGGLAQVAQRLSLRVAKLQESFQADALSAASRPGTA